MEKDLREIRKDLKKEQRELLINKFLHNRLAMSGSVILLIIVILALAAPILHPLSILSEQMLTAGMYFRECCTEQELHW